jgi:peptidoglycan hydrolase-like protein with peptidoglycan-binding domain
MGRNLNAARFSGNPQLEAALLSNQNAIAKPLSGLFVKLIQQSLLDQGYPLPIFGADGSFGDETERAAKSFQTDAGAEQIDGKVGPETMQLLDMHDSGLTVETAAPTPGATLLSVHFEETPDFEFVGFDASITPRVLVVPEGGRRTLPAIVSPANVVPTYTTDDPAVALAHAAPAGAVVTGVQRGVTFLRARDGGGGVFDEVEVHVKARREVTVDFFFVRDLIRGTQRTDADVPRLLATLNRVWERQANVRFHRRAVNRALVPLDLGDPILIAGGTDPKWLRATAMATTRGDRNHFNIFLVWDCDGGAPHNAHGLTIGTEAMVDDPGKECPDHLTVAHEAGHFLLPGGAQHGASGILAPCGGPGRRRVFAAEAGFVNPS